MKQRVCVVGAGVVGIFAARVLKQQGCEVTLIDPAPAPGGLLRSVKAPWGPVDYGTHVHSEIGVPEIDALLYDEMDDASWRTHEHIRGGTHFAGQLSEDSPFINACSLPTDLFQAGLAELLAVDELPPERTYADLEEQLVATFGRTMTQAIHAPILKKMTGVELSALAVDSHRLFGLTRLVCGTPEWSAQIKQQHAWHDARIAHAHYTLGSAGRRHWYPRREGIGLWVDRQVSRMREAGIDLRWPVRVVAARHEGGSIKTLALSDGTQIEVDRVVWTAPPHFLLGAAGVEMPSGLQAPTFCRTQLFHLQVSEPVNSPCHFITSHDPDFRIFRVTLYQNLRDHSEESATPLTVEVLLTPGSSAMTTEAVLSELREMRLLSSSAHLLAEVTEDIHPGFPVMTPAFVDSSQVLAQKASQEFANVELLGRAAGGSFFMSDVLKDAWQRLADT